ncbi:MAG TPA: peptidoglycan-binding protein, partial [Actinomycetota bacterium]|nr:peptidoglycan-binding protein [Actinomycetota bacterium]
APGANGARVLAMHALLAEVGQPTTNGDTFGNETVAALQAVQAAAGQSPTGVANANTWALLFMTPDRAPAPAVSGTGQVTQTLSATAGQWGPGTFTFTYQWYRAGKLIGGATEASYTLQPDDAGAPVTVAVTGARPGYTTVTRTSDPTAAVEMARLSATPTPRITGKAVVGESLTAAPETWSPDSVKLSYQWYRGATPIPGATALTYAVQAADLGAKLMVAVAGDAAGYQTVTMTSEATEAVSMGTLSAKNPTITGKRKVGKTLTAVPGIWSPSGVSLTYRWYRGSARIAGATKETYTLVKADRGKIIRVRVLGTLPGYATLEKASGRTRVS